MEVQKTTLDSERCEERRKEIENAQKTLKLAKKYQNTKKEASAYYDLAWLYYHVGDYTQSTTYGKNLQKISKKMMRKEFEAKAYEVLAWAYKDYGDYEKSKEFSKELLRISKELDDM